MTGVRVIGDQLQVLQAFLALGQQDLSIQQKFLQGAALWDCAVHQDTPVRRAGAENGHAMSIASKSLTPFMQ